MSQVSHLGKIPNEILARIVQFLRSHYGFVRNSDLKACRLVDRQISAVATREFAKANFGSLSVVFSTHALQILANICAHPNLGAYVRNISISSQRTSPKSILALTDIFRNNLKEGNLDDLDDISRYMQEYIQTCHDEYTLEKSGQAIHLITTALVALKDRGIRVNISIDNDLPFRAIGYTGTFRQLSYYPQERNRDHTNKTAHIIFQALSQSCCQVNSFEVYQHDFDDSVMDHCDRLVDLADSSEPALEGFAMLKSLDLTFQRLPEQKTLNSLDRLLGQLCHLERLSLSLEWDSDRRYRTGMAINSSAVVASDTLLSSLSSVCLQQVELHNVCISEKRLVSILSVSRGSLKSLELRSICLDKGCWNRVFSWAHDKLQLDKLKLFDLSEARLGSYAHRWNVEKMGQSTLILVGKEDIRSGLSELLSGGN